MTAVFFDSNIAVYAVDPRDQSASKRAIARDLLMDRKSVFSTQVLMETFNVLVRKDLMDVELAHSYIRRLSNSTVISVEREDVLESLDKRSVYQISHWDGLIVRAAEKAKTPILYSEDLNHGQTYGSVRVCNPFIEDFLA